MQHSGTAETLVRDRNYFVNANLVWKYDDE